MAANWYQRRKFDTIIQSDFIPASSVFPEAPFHSWNKL